MARFRRDNLAFEGGDDAIRDRSVEARLLGHQATIIYFAVIDPIAAVGLWLGNVWGGVMWLLAIMSHLILSFFFPSVVPSNTVSIGFILAYLAISWLAAGEEGR